MADIYNELFDDTCWVYVQAEEDGAYVVGITYDREFRERESAQGRAPLFWKRFDDTLSAAGYRIVLKELPAAALQQILDRYGGRDQERE